MDYTKTSTPCHEFTEAVTKYTSSDGWHQDKPTVSEGTKAVPKYTSLPTELLARTGSFWALEILKFLYIDNIGVPGTPPPYRATNSHWAPQMFKSLYNHNMGEPATPLHPKIILIFLT